MPKLWEVGKNLDEMAKGAKMTTDAMTRFVSSRVSRLRALLKRKKSKVKQAKNKDEEE